ncbi:nucleoid-associated protein YejK [Pseudomonas eucalypticola]|uniref:Nucleoid-associated protein YejK n=1 Tax=Pseudomonas eucalypticola TaxID=2599595 RepID=A0A7D5H1M9_9PSED|nr:nucleoid-associated protein YejK [Pseudomonas eucalypticola]QKZ05867.1 nucleoid-associated protein YejK [Pseudomonas eucalypticola]
MPIRHMIIHQIDKKPDGSPAMLHLADQALPESQACETLLQDFNDSYNAKQGKGWGLFHPESDAYPLCGWLAQHLAGSQTFVEFSRDATEYLCKLLEESNLSAGGHVLFAQYQQGMTDYLTIAMLQQVETVSVDDQLRMISTRSLDARTVTLAARINLSEWQNNAKSRQYISFIKGKGGKKFFSYFQDFIGCQEGVDGPGETRTLLKAFTDFVEAEDMDAEATREKTLTLLDYATTQTKIGGLATLDELSEVIDEDNPKAFADFARAAAYGLSPELPIDKRTINQFRRFTGRAEGLLISFESHLLGTKVEFDQAGGTLTLRGLPTQLTDQLKRTR